MKASQINKNFYKFKRVLVTGHTGFKGSWLIVMLNEFGANTRGYALAPEDGSLFSKIRGEELVDHIEGNICNFDRFKKAVNDFQPEIIMHLAAVSNIPQGLSDPYNAYITNILGTVNLFEAIRESSSVKSVLVITSDKVYENKGDGALYSEIDKLGGIDPYSVSKVAQDLIAHSYKQTYMKEIGVATGRASNVLAGGDHNQTRLIPTILNSFASGRAVEIRNPNQQRPWQSIFDALNGYLTIARRCFEEPQKFSGPWNVGPTKDGIRTVAEIVSIMQKYYMGNSIGYTYGKKIEAIENATLGLDIAKSIYELGWEPEQTFEQALEYIVLFFKYQQDKVSEYEICKKQIREFLK